MKGEKLFEAIGGAEPALLERSEQTRSARRGSPWLKWGISAACLALVVCAVVLFPTGEKPLPPGPVVTAPEPTATTPEPVEPGVIADGTGGFHLLQLSGEEQTPEFVIYFNEETYRGREADGAYLIEPIGPLPENVPECKLEIVRMEDTTLEAAAELMTQILEGSYDNLSQPEPATRVTGLFFHGSSSEVRWDGEEIDVYLVEDGQGGVFRISAFYFTEATEGHGVRFADMVSTFQVVDAAAEAAQPEWLTALKETTAVVMPAVFSNQLSGAQAVLAQGGLLDGYGEDVSSDVSICAVDYTVDDDRTPSDAVVSVKHRLGGEDSYAYLTIELSYEQDRWLVDWAGIEK